MSTTATKIEPDSDLITTRQVAKLLSTDPRTLRKYLRSADRGVGKGNRYAFERKEVPSLKKGFAKWNAEQERQAQQKKLSEDELQGMSVKQLRAHAAERQIEAPSKAKKDEIVAALLS